MQTCDKCSNKLPSSILRQSFSGLSNQNIRDDEDITWFTWLRISNKINLQEIKGSISMLLDSIDEQWMTIVTHDYIKTQQKTYIENIKKSSSANTYAIVTLDFAENYTLVPQREVQSAH